MIERYSENRTIYYRAQQIWLILIAKAHNRQTVTYQMIADILEFGGSGTLGNMLYPIKDYCSQNELPPLSAIVVQKSSGETGSGAQEYNLKDREAVFSFNWYDIVPPTPIKLKEVHKNK